MKTLLRFFLGLVFFAGRVALVLAFTPAILWQGTALAIREARLKRKHGRGYEGPAAD